MIDFAKITVRAGDGGNGSGSRRQIKGKRYGRADGGDGGRGGDAYFAVSGDLNTLESYRFVKNYKAQNGQSGSSNLKRGATGEDLILKVPIGTQVNLTNESNEAYDLVAGGDKVLIARGGQGGRGNAHLRDEFGRRPAAGELGGEGEKVDLTLELKLIADIGLIGLPNAGKSTLLASLTAARPRIAAYPFTTLEPNLGVMKIENSQLVLADIPGLIEGASTGRGLGDLFLRHIERTKVLVHLIDASGDSEKWNDYQVVRRELKTFSKNLTKKKEIIVLAKIDLATREGLREAIKFFKAHRKKVIPISAMTGEGLINLKQALYKGDSLT